MEQTERRILMIHGNKVVLDADPAALYGVPTKCLNEQVKRNAECFPNDLVFRLAEEESKSLGSQFTTSKKDARRHSRPYVFTEHGAIMAANVLNSKRAIHMSVYVVRAFVRLRQELFTPTDMEKRLVEIEKTLIGCDAAFRDLYEKMRSLLLPSPATPRSGIGFRGGDA